MNLESELRAVARIALDWIKEDRWEESEILLNMFYEYADNKEKANEDHT